jgi:hypothetical protein
MTKFNGYLTLMIGFFMLIFLKELERSATQKIMDERRD